MPILPAQDRRMETKAFLKVKPARAAIEVFKANLTTMLNRSNETESEEFHKNWAHFHQQARKKSNPLIHIF